MVCMIVQIKLASVKLAMKYMKRVSAELETVGGGPEEEELIVQGVRFAFRVHQVKSFFPVSIYLQQFLVLRLLKDSILISRFDGLSLLPVCRGV